jgi:hypothetical protein
MSLDSAPIECVDSTRLSTSPPEKPSILLETETSCKSGFQFQRISVIGGDTQVAAISAAISLGDRFMVEGPGVQPIRVCLERNAQCFKGSVQLAGRKKPLRHLIALSEELASSNVSASSGRTLLASSQNQFIWASIAHIHGIPGVPDWADWFAGELKTHQAIMLALGIGCEPVIVKGQKEQFLDWLSWGVESEAIKFPDETGSIHWPSLGLQDILFHACASSGQ